MLDINNQNFDARSIVHLINSHGNELVGLELGVYMGVSFMGLLNNCPNIKTLYGVDSWQPFSDYIRPTYDPKNPTMILTEEDIEIAKFTTYVKINHSEHKDKAIILEKDSNDALNDIPDNYLDFIFLDAHLTSEQIINDLEVWYPKVKKGGIYAGHDWSCNMVQDAVFNFRKTNNITSLLSTFDDTFVWIK